MSPRRAPGSTPERASLRRETGSVIPPGFVAPDLIVMLTCFWRPEAR